MPLKKNIENPHINLIYKNDYISDYSAAKNYVALKIHRSLAYSEKKRLHSGAMVKKKGGRKSLVVP